MANRIFAHLRRPTCSCGRARRKVREWERLAERIERCGDGIIETVTPSLGKVIEGKADGGLRLCILAEPDPVTNIDGAFGQVAADLRRLAERLDEAADRLDAEGGAR